MPRPTKKSPEGKASQIMEKEKKPKVEKEKKPNVERVLEKAFGAGLISKANEGHHGIILELNLPEFSPDDQAELRRYFRIPEAEAENMAVKVLKIYSSAEAARECQAQAAAAKAINSQEGLQNSVGVPECYSGGGMRLSSKRLQKRLAGLGAKINADNVGLIMMDFIPGDDLGIYCYKQFIKVNFDKFKAIAGIEHEVDPAEYDLYLNGQPIDDLILIAHQILGIKAEHQYFDDSLDAQQERNEIAKLLILGIENRGMFDKQKVVALKEALGKMHAQGVYHRDLHLRNIIVDPAGKLFMVDFGSAAIASGGQTENEQNIYRTEEGAQMQKDEDILVFLNKLAATPEDIAAKQIDQQLNNAVRIKKAVFEAVGASGQNAMSKKRALAWRSLLGKATSNQDMAKALRDFDHDLGEYIEGDSYFDYQLAGLMLLAEAGQSQAVKDYCRAILLQETANQILVSKINAWQIVD